MQPLSGNQRPDLLTPLMNMSLILRLPQKMHLCRSSSNVPRLPPFLEMLQYATKTSRFAHFWQGAQSLAPATRNDIWTSKSGPNIVFLTFWLRNVLRVTTACTFSTSQLLKVVRTWCVLYILTSKWASRHNGVHFFDISISKSVREWCALYILTSKCASRHKGVQLFISHLASWLRTRRFSEPTFLPPGTTNHWKNTIFRDFPTFWRTPIFFLLTFSLLWSSLFCSSLLYSSAPPLLFICPYCRKFDF